MPAGFAPELRVLPRHLACPERSHPAAAHSAYNEATSPRRGARPASGFPLSFPPEFFIVFCVSPASNKRSRLSSQAAPAAAACSLCSFSAWRTSRTRGEKGKRAASARGGEQKVARGWEGFRRAAEAARCRTCFAFRLLICFYRAENNQKIRKYQRPLPSMPKEATISRAQCTPSVVFARRKIRSRRYRKWQQCISHPGDNSPGIYQKYHRCGILGGAGGGVMYNEGVWQRRGQNRLEHQHHPVWWAGMWVRQQLWRMPWWTSGRGVTVYRRCANIWRTTVEDRARRSLVVWHAHNFFRLEAWGGVCYL